MHQQRFLANGPRRILLPSSVAAFLPFSLLWLPPDHWRLVPLLSAAALTITIGVVALRVGEQGLRAWGISGLARAYLIVVVLLRAADGPSGVAATAAGE